MAMVSIIICTKDRPRELNGALRSILQQTRLPDEIIIVDASGPPAVLDSSVTTSPISLKIIRTQPSLVKQRNIGLQHVSPQTDIILFIDDDVELSEDYLKCMMKAFAEDCALFGATGHITNLPKRRRWTFCGKNGYVDKLARNFFADRPDGNRDLMWLSGCNMAFRSEVFARHRFDEFFEAYGLGEDLEFSFRVGQTGKLAFVPDAKLVHHESPVARINSRRLGHMYVKNKMYIAKKHGYYFSVRCLYLFLAVRALSYMLCGMVDGNSRDLFRGYLDAFAETGNLDS